MFVADMHCDSLSAVNENNGLINGYNTSKKHPFLQFFPSFTPRAGKSLAERRGVLAKQINVYLYETDRLGIKRINNVKELNEAVLSGTSCSVLTLEGGGGLLADSEELFTAHKLGLRVMGLAWDSNELAAGALEDDDFGLTDEGRRMLHRMAELGIVADVSHLSDMSFYDLCEVYPLPIIATHSNFREVCKNPRNLTDDMADIIVKRGGLIGINLYPSFLRREGDATEEDILRHIDYGLSKFGERALAFGFDIDGVSGKYPRGIDCKESIHDRVCELLLKNYHASVVDGISGGNVIDFLRGILD